MEGLLAPARPVRRSTGVKVIKVKPAYTDVWQSSSMKILTTDGYGFPVISGYPVQDDPLQDLSQATMVLLVNLGLRSAQIFVNAIVMSCFHEPSVLSVIDIGRMVLVIANPTRIPDENRDLSFLTPRPHQTFQSPSSDHKSEPSSRQVTKLYDQSNPRVRRLF
ncbi:hypothetical protein RB195_011329 [Necator americanus]|uniref:Uncharacterized protein n=1 Tax=Necator americanus TaxID=51031 RepID=A0ABR1D1Z0_NECAM